ncbi:uncharacterized protein [Haliotis asinina]|uniref:uncharacterized protein n=1 Tax=Haliotis asinina TaxID=109174 RepID=UPI0035321088
MQAEFVTSFGDKRKLVRNTAEKPFAAIANLEGVGTGFLSKIDDTFVVVTAGHCLQKEELSITFGENSPTVQPFHPLKIRVNKILFGLPSNYNKCSSSDFGIILLKDQNYFKEKNIFLPLEIERGQRPVMMSDYPGLNTGYPVKTQWDIEVTDCRADGAFLWYRDATTGGNSGSPLFVNQNGNYAAVGIHIAGDYDSNIGIKITKHVIDAMRRLVYSVKRRLELEEERVIQKQEVKRTLMELADELDKQQKDIRIAKTSFASAGVASAGAAIAGVILLPFTFGGSLALTAGGIAGGVLSGAGTLATNKAEKIINSQKMKAAQEAIRKINVSHTHCTNVEGETGGHRAAATGITTMMSILPPVLIGLNIAEIVSNSIKIDKKSPSEVAEQIRSIAHVLD